MSPTDDVPPPEAVAPPGGPREPGPLPPIRQVEALFAQRRASLRQERAELARVLVLLVRRHAPFAERLFPDALAEPARAFLSRFPTRAFLTPLHRDEALALLTSADRVRAQALLAEAPPEAPGPADHAAAVELRAAIRRLRAVETELDALDRDLAELRARRTRAPASFLQTLRPAEGEPGASPSPPGRGEAPQALPIRGVRASAATAPATLQSAPALRARVAVTAGLLRLGWLLLRRDALAALP
ncbi:MAG: hypothetical protein FJ029_11390, partial [Actinobacteria bacterium]|nr:hypothetical protein [Actinomycetota bacterium]